MSVYKVDPKGPTYLGEFSRILPAEEGEPTPRKWDLPDLTPVKMEIRTGRTPRGDEKYRIVELVPTPVIAEALVCRSAPRTHTGGLDENPHLSGEQYATFRYYMRRWLLWNDPDACEVAAREVGLDLHDFEQPEVELLRFLGREFGSAPSRKPTPPISHDRGDVPSAEQSMSEWIDFYMGPEA